MIVGLLLHCSCCSSRKLNTQWIMYSNSRCIRNREAHMESSSSIGIGSGSGAPICGKNIVFASDGFCSSDTK
ncbi:hypothetical protein RIF29_17727 [Crotalaria pallida]|uniref:Uncharacterized protein n=1 Tax=Crotalaria pallida TaxID=3830 RepID=A0AAN9FHT7_CROPI